MSKRQDIKTASAKMLEWETKALREEEEDGKKEECTLCHGVVIID